MKELPKIITGALYGHFSVARHFGAMRLNGVEYVWRHVAPESYGGVLTKKGAYKKTDELLKALENKKEK